MEAHKISITALLLLTSRIHDTCGQRPLWPTDIFDMSMYDAAELCHKIAEDKAGGSRSDSVKGKDFLPPRDNCYFFQWIYCPNVPERPSPCGWWVQKPCNITDPRVGHFAPKERNPPGVMPPDPNAEELSEWGDGGAPPGPSDGTRGTGGDDLGYKDPLMGFGDSPIVPDYNAGPGGNVPPEGAEGAPLLDLGGAPAASDDRGYNPQHQGPPPGEFPPGGEEPPPPGEFPPGGEEPPPPGEFPPGGEEPPPPEKRRKRHALPGPNRYIASKDKKWSVMTKYFRISNENN